jgi:hypothetical protein
MEERDKVEYPQKEGIIKSDTSGTLYFDPLSIKTFADLITNMTKRVTPDIRKKGLENYLSTMSIKQLHSKQ